MPSDNCFIPENVNCEDKIPSKVNLDRPWQNRVAGAVFISACIIQYVLSILTLSSVEDPLVCTGLGTASGAFESVDFSAGFGNAMKTHVGAFLLTLFIALTAGFMWIFSLQKCSRIVVWGTLITEMLLGLALAIAAFANPGLVGLGVTILVLDGFALLVIIIKKKAVDQAAFMLQSAAYCIQYNCSLVVVALFILICLIAYSIVPIAGMAASFIAGNWVKINPSCNSSTSYCACYLQQPNWINGARVFCNLVLVWVFFVSNMMRCYVVGVTAAFWYWHPDSKGRPCTGLKWALSTSFGTLSLGGLVVTIVDRINEWASSKTTACCCLCCNPLYLIFYVIMMIYKEVVNALAKFCILIAGITGEDFFVCVGRSYYTLKGKFSTLFVVDGVAKLVMYSAAGVFSVAMWAFAWFVAAGISGEDTIGYQQRMWEQEWYMQALQVILWVFGGIMVYYPLVGIIVLVLWGAVIFGTFFGTSFLIGVFAGCLANYFFTFFADVILDVTSAMFTIVRIDHKNGIRIQGDLSEGSPAAVGNYYYKLSGDAETTEMASTQSQSSQQQTVVQATVYVQQQPGAVAMAQPVMMAQPMMAQPMMAQPMVYAQPGYGQPGVAYAQPPGYQPSDPYDASKPPMQG